MANENAPALWAILEALRLLAFHVARLNPDPEVRAEIDAALEDVDEAISAAEGR